MQIKSGGLYLHAEKEAISASFLMLFSALFRMTGFYMTLGTMISPVPPQ